MKAFHGDEAVKEKYLARLKAHHEADEIIQGQGGDGSHGCAVGCTLNKYDHSAYENELGLPRWLAHLEDTIFEGLTPVDAQRFAVDFLEAVPVGADVENVRWQLAVQRHTRDRDRLLLNSEPYAKQCVDAIDLVIAYCESHTKTESAQSSAGSAQSAAESAWSAARSARSAQSAARSAARSAAQSAESAAQSAESAAQSAESAAWSAELAAWSAAWSAELAAWSTQLAADHFRWEAETLLALLRNAPQATE